MRAQNNLVYSGLARIPWGHADTRRVTPGCLVLEGGAFRGLYTQGALDALMMNDINIQTTIGVSAGALSGLNYVAGQIGRSARINLSYRHDPNYVGLGALRRDHGVTGFTFVFEDVERVEPLDRETFNDPRRRFVAVATNVQTGKATYFEKGACSDILKAVQASASVPYVSRPVEIDGCPYLDGGCADAVPVDWAFDRGFKKVLVIRTRNRSYRKGAGAPSQLIDVEYGKYPAMAATLRKQNDAYNILAGNLEELEAEGRIFVIAPKHPIGISRFEGDMEKLGALYWEGFEAAKALAPQIKAYFAA